MENKKRLIDANALIIEDLLVMDGDYVDEFASGVRKVMNAIRRLPTVDAVEVVHGRWIMYLDGDSIMPDRFYRCSECCDRGWGRKWPYCPNCGAKMDGGVKNG